MIESALSVRDSVFAEVTDPEQKGTFKVKATRTRPAVEVSADGTGVVSHAGSRLIADLADQTTLTAQLSAVFGGGGAADRA